MFDGQYMQQPMFQQQFQSFAQAGASATASFTQSTATGTSTAAPSSATNTPRSARSESTASPKDNEDRGWIKESKVTKVTPQGTRETTVKKTAADVSVSFRLISKGALVAVAIIRVGVSGFAWNAPG